MKAERVILSFIALLIGLGVAGGVFYLYQTTKNAPAKKTQALPTVTLPSPTSVPSKHIFILDKPGIDDVVSTSSITVSGKSEKDAMIIIRSESEQQVAEPSENGSFTLTLPLEDGANIFTFNAIFPDGTQLTETRTVTYTTETF